jgi:hypothetical protein
LKRPVDEHPNITITTSTTTTSNTLGSHSSQLVSQFSGELQTSLEQTVCQHSITKLNTTTIRTTPTKVCVSLPTTPIHHNDMTCLSTGAYHSVGSTTMSVLNNHSVLSTTYYLLTGIIYLRCFSNTLLTIFSLYVRYVVLQSRFIQILQNLQSTRPCKNSCCPLFIFERNAQAAQHNAAILRSYNFDLQTAILDQPKPDLFWLRVSKVVRPGRTTSRSPSLAKIEGNN